MQDLHLRQSVKNYTFLIHLRALDLLSVPARGKLQFATHILPTLWEFLCNTSHLLIQLDYMLDKMQLPKPCPSWWTRKIKYALTRFVH